MRILITAFEPFGGDAENASREAMRRLVAGWTDPAHTLVGVELPCVFARAPLAEAVARHSPDAVLCLGEAGGRRGFTPEARAVNDATARIPDNAGRQPHGERIDDGGPDVRAATWSPDDATSALRAAGWASSTSEDAGRFVCNWTAYLAYGLEQPALFVHVPALRSSGTAGVGAETGGADEALEGRVPNSFDDLAAGLAAMLTATLPALGEAPALA